jgi:Flp pilus assembly protein TadB
MAGSETIELWFACAAIVLAVVGVLVAWLAPSQGLRTSVVLAFGGVWTLCLMIRAGRRTRQARRVGDT